MNKKRDLVNFSVTRKLLIGKVRFFKMALKNFFFSNDQSRFIPREHCHVAPPPPPPDSPYQLYLDLCTCRVLST